MYNLDVMVNDITKSKLEHFKLFRWTNIATILCLGAFTPIRNSFKCSKEYVMPSGIYQRKSLKERFDSKWERNYETKCWEWLGTNRRYGQIRINKKTKSAHRVSWRLYKGEIPEGLYVCHKCDNPSCVNPNHLFLGTQEDNMKDMINKGRQHNRNGILNSFYGKSHTQETIKNLSNKAKLRTHTEATKTKIALKMKSRIMTEEHKRRISEANKGKVISEETRIKMSLNHHKRKKS